MSLAETGPTAHTLSRYSGACEAFARLPAGWPGKPVCRSRNHKHGLRRGAGRVSVRPELTFPRVRTTLSRGRPKARRPNRETQGSDPPRTTSMDNHARPNLLAGQGPRRHRRAWSGLSSVCPACDVVVRLLACQPQCCRAHPRAAPTPSDDSVRQSTGRSGQGRARDSRLSSPVQR